MADPPIRSIADLDVGSVVDRYEIVRHVARGGMGSVWLARFSGKHGFAKRVALKTIRADFANDPHFRAMFLDEARITARLSHANVAQVLDVGEHASLVYIVFEWVDGHSLEEACRSRPPIALDFLLRLMAETCAGLHAAHELRNDDGAPLGVVHRDVSPTNVLVSDLGFAKVIDFGVAKARDRIAPETRSGVVKGTPQYMAPEQARAEPVDRRADVWAVGATLYRTLAGAPAFADRDALAAFIQGAPLPELPASVPSSVRAIVEQAMRREPADRYPTADAMRTDLEAAGHRVRESRSKMAIPTSATAEVPTAMEAAAVDAERRRATPSQPRRPEKSALTNTMLGVALGVAALAATAALVLSQCA